VIRIRLPATGAAARHEFIRLVWATGALLVCLLPHLPRLPVWISLLTAACVGWRLVAALRRWRSPSRGLRIVLATGGFAGVIASYGTVNGVEAGSALLVVMMDMKLLETWRRRDYQVLMFIAYFLILSQLLYGPGIWTLPWMVLAVWVTTVALLQSVRVAAPLPAASAGRLVARMLAFALPIMLMLFLLFPRVPGPFWAMPTRSGGASTGLSDEMSPGAITALSRSDAVAFRVSFEGRIPPPTQRYWRGPVLHHFDGTTWRETTGVPQRTDGLVPAGEPVRYRITLEPHDRPWLLALDYPEFWTETDAYRSSDYQLLSRRPVDQLMAYDVRSFPDALTDLRLGRLTRTMELRLPEGRNPETVELANSLRAAHGDDRELLKAVLTRFREEPYVYTMQPPALRGAHPVDEFLFGTRRGFCEHFASAFTVLMRAAGIPARIVTGYQGGEVNPLSRRMTVRQSDAHAWSEIWLEGEGWVRVDPTAAVAPERIELSLADALPAGERIPGQLLRTLPGLQQLRQGWDAVDAAWNEWVLGYGPERQIALLRSLGFNNPDWRNLAVVLGILVGLALAGVTAWLAWHYRPPRPDETLRLYQRFLQRLARHGVTRHHWEGPIDFADRASRQRPGDAAAIGGITRSYVRLRYGEGTGPGEVDRLRRLVNAFRPA
jgi:transglutaminase-like putative cysteine protease